MHEGDVSQFPSGFFTKLGENEAFYYPDITLIRSTIFIMYRSVAKLRHTAALICSQNCDRGLGNFRRHLRKERKRVGYFVESQFNFLQFLTDEQTPGSKVKTEVPSLNLARLSNCPPTPLLSFPLILDRVQERRFIRRERLGSPKILRCALFIGS